MNQLMNDIIQNYRQQLDLYTVMLKLSEEQLQILESRSGSTDQILADRHQLMSQIGELNRLNLIWQEQMCKDAQLDQFNLTNIAPFIDADTATEIRSVLNALGQLLQLIDENDQRIHHLMNQHLNTNLKRQRTTSQKAAGAYKQSMTRPPQN